MRLNIYSIRNIYIETRDMHIENEIIREKNRQKQDQINTDIIQKLNQIESGLCKLEQEQSMTKTEVCELLETISKG